MVPVLRFVVLVRVGAVAFFAIAFATFDPAGTGFTGATFAEVPEDDRRPFGLAVDFAAAPLAFFCIDSMVLALCSWIDTRFFERLVVAEPLAVDFRGVAFLVAVMTTEFTARVRLWVGDVQVYDREIKNQPRSMTSVGMETFAVLKDFARWRIELSVDPKEYDYVKPIEWGSQSNTPVVVGAKAHIGEVVRAFGELHERIFDGPQDDD